MSDEWNELQCDELFFEANQLTRENKTTEAITVLRKILSIDPIYGKAFNHLGWVYETKYQDYAKADEFYKLGLKYSPEYPPVYHNYAVVLSTMHRFDELAELLEKALKVPGINHAKIWNEYGIMYEFQGQFDKAIEAYEKRILYLLDQKSIDQGAQSIQRVRRKKEILEEGNHLTVS